MKMLFTTIALFGSVILSTSVAHAQWYIGGALTQAESDQGVGFDILPTSETDDSTDIAWKVLAGYDFSSTFAVEFGYSDLGDEYTNFNIFGNSEKTEIDVSAIYATLVGRANVHNQVDVFGRLGLAFWNVDLDYIEPGFNSSGSDNDLDLVVGFGFAWRLNEGIGVRFEWEQFQNVGDEVKTNLPSSNRLQLRGQDINVLAIGITYSFY